MLMMNRALAVSSVIGVEWVGLLVSVGLIVDVREDVAVVVGERFSSACHNSLGYLEEFHERHVGEARGGAFRERWHECSWEARTVNVYTHAKHGGGVEHAVDAHLGVVAHYQTAELQTSAQEAGGGVVP